MPDSTATPTRTRATATRKAAAAKRSTAAKKAATTRAASSTPRAASSTPRAKTAVKAPKLVAENAERAALVQIGATLLARDAVVDALGSLRSSSVSTAKGLQARQRRFEQELDRYEKRGAAARGRVRGDLRKASDRVTTEIQEIGKHATSTTKDVAAGADVVSARVGRIVQSGLSASSKTAAKVGARLPFGG